MGFSSTEILIIIVTILVIIVISIAISRKFRHKYNIKDSNTRSNSCHNSDEGFFATTENIPSESADNKQTETHEDTDIMDLLETEVQQLESNLTKIKDTIKHINEIKAKPKDTTSSCTCQPKIFDLSKVANGKVLQDIDTTGGTDENKIEMPPAVHYIQLFSAETFVMPGVAALTLYGFTNDNKVADLSYSKIGLAEGIGIWDDQFNRYYDGDNVADRADEFNFRKEKGWLDMKDDQENTHRLDNKHYIQIDAFQLLPYYKHKCDNPTLIISALKKGGGFQIGGSNIQSEFGVEIFQYINEKEEGDNSNQEDEVELSLFNPADLEYPILFKYISIRSYPLGKTYTGGHILLKNITINICD